MCVGGENVEKFQKVKPDEEYEFFRHVCVRTGVLLGVDCVYMIFIKKFLFGVCVMYMGSALFLYTYNGPSSHGTLY